MEYLDFDLEIEPLSSGDYRVIARSPAGEARQTMRFPFDDDALEKHLLKLQNALLRSATTHRRMITDEEQAVQQFGQALFDALLAGEVRTRYTLSRSKAAQEGKGLRLRLRIETPQLAALPWEYLYDQDEAEYVCLSLSTPLVRYLELPRPIQPLAVAPPLRILGMTASPNDLDALDVSREQERMHAALADLEARGLVELTWLEGRTWRDLQQAMWAGPWHIFHFIGHGDFDASTDEGVIALEDERGKMYPLRATQLGRLLADHGSLRLVVLNACRGARGGQRDIFSSTAAIVARRGIPAVLAMQEEITDRAAIELTRTFYSALGQGLPVDAAVAAAREAISVGIRNSLEWGTPVLYLRAPDGLLFRLTAPPTPRKSGATRPASSPAEEPTVKAARSAQPAETTTKSLEAPDKQEQERARQFERKLAEAEAGAKQNPNDSDSWYDTGYYLSLLKRHKEAIAAYERAIQLYPQFTWAFIGKADALNALKRYPEALAAAEQAIQLDPQNPRARRSQADTLMGLKRFRAARDAYERAIQLNPNDALARQGKEAAFKEITAAWDRTIQGDPSESSIPVNAASAAEATPPAQETAPSVQPLAPPQTKEQWVALGEARYAAKRIELALAAYDAALQLDPNDASAHKQRGAMLYTLQRFAEALEATERAIQLDPSYAAALYNKGVILGGLNHYQEAVAAYDQALQFAPNDIGTLNNRANMLIQLDRYQEALESLERALQLDPKMALAYRNKGIALANLQRFEEALIALDRAIELNPAYTEAYVNKAAALGRLERYEEALALFDRALQVEPDHVSALYNKGIILGKLQRYEEAIACFDRAIQLAPNYTLPYNDKGVMLCLLDRYEESLEPLQRALQLDPNYEFAHNNLAVALRGLKRYDESLAACERAIQLDPHDINAHTNKGKALLGLARKEEAEAAFQRARELEGPGLSEQPPDAGA